MNIMDLTVQSFTQGIQLLYNEHSSDCATCAYPTGDNVQRGNTNTVIALARTCDDLAYHFDIWIFYTSRKLISRLLLK